MSFLRRFAFFIALNVVVMVTLSLVINLLGLRTYIDDQGINYVSLMVFCLIWGMGGAFISLMLSKIMAKWAMGVQIIDPNSAGPEERRLVETVYRLARTAGLEKMPEVGIYQSPEVNAFATGPSRNNSLVAVSAGLLQSMDSRSVDGVLGHEVAHIANGDMVTMTLLQGVVNAFVMALARIVAFAIDSFLKGDRDRGGLGHMGYMLVVFVLEMILFIPGSMIVAWFSRQREFRADRGGAQYSGRDNMISALKSLHRLHEVNVATAGQTSPAIAAFKIDPGQKKSSMMMLFSTHPPLEERIARLERGT